LSIAGNHQRHLHMTSWRHLVWKFILFYLWNSKSILKPAIYVFLSSNDMLVVVDTNKFLGEWLTYGWWGCIIEWNCMGGVGQCLWSHPLALSLWLEMERLKHLRLEDHDVMRVGPKVVSLMRILSEARIKVDSLIPDTISLTIVGNIRDDSGLCRCTYNFPL